MKHITFLLLAFASMLMTACDAHQDFPDTTIKPAISFVPMARSFHSLSTKQKRSRLLL